jgi:hypothetical protein
MGRDLGLDDVVDHFTLVGDELELLRNKGFRPQVCEIQRHCHRSGWRRADSQSNRRPAGLTGLALVACRRPRTFGVA